MYGCKNHNKNITCQIIDNIFVYVHKVNITAKSEKNCDAMNKSENYTHITYKKK